MPWFKSLSKKILLIVNIDWELSILDCAKVCKRFLSKLIFTLLSSAMCSKVYVFFLYTSSTKEGKFSRSRFLWEIAVMLASLKDRRSRHCFLFGQHLKLFHLTFNSYHHLLLPTHNTLSHHKLGSSDAMHYILWSLVWHA